MSASTSIIFLRCFNSKNDLKKNQEHTSYIKCTITYTILHIIIDVSHNLTVQPQSSRSKKKFHMWTNQAHIVTRKK